MPANVAAIVARTPAAMDKAREVALKAAFAPITVASVGVASAASGASVPSVAGASGTSVAEKPPLPPFMDYSGKLKRSQTLSGALAQYGVGSRQVNAIVSVLQPYFSFRRARPGARYALRVRTADGWVESFRFEHSALEIFETYREGEVLKGRKVAVQTRQVTVAFGGRVSSTLSAAVRSSGESGGIAAKMIEVFAWDIDFYKDTRPGDRFKVMVEKVFKDDTFIRYGRIVAAEYESVLKKETFRTFWFEVKEGEGGYFLEDGQSARKTFLATPLKFVRISSGFNLKRKHPVLGYTRAHMGVDFAAPTGTPIWAMADGVVRFAARKGANGNLIVIRHKGGLVSLYAHLNSIKVKRGQKVRQKQIIGTVGTTGRSTGPHLHFGLKKNGKYVNPQSMKMARGESVSSRWRGKFKANVATRLVTLAAVKMGRSSTVKTPSLPEPAPESPTSVAP